jgi:hypothetical protein
MARTTHWALPAIALSLSLGLVACGSSDADEGGSGGSNCVPTTGSSGTGGSTATSTTASSSSSSGSGGSTGSGIPEDPGGIGGLTTGNEGNTFDHFNDPGSNGSKDPFELLKERAEEGPPEIRTRIHSCSKIPYTTLGAMLTSLGVNLAATATGGQPPTAGQLYTSGADAMSVAHFDAREGEAAFHTTAGATKLFDIFVQASSEIIANIQNMPLCQLNGTGKPMFDAEDGSCVPESLSCIMGRPATAEDEILCNLLISQAKDANDLIIKQRIAVASFLAAAHTCE